MITLRKVVVEVAYKPVKIKNYVLKNTINIKNGK
jgi:hypothetical protein